MMLDRKYRPRKFRDVVGNDGVVKLLTIRSKSGTLGGRSMMFSGPKGCGKTSLARIVARALVCDSLEDGEPCGECGPCLSVSAGTSMSADEFDAATQGTVERIRNILDDLEYGTVDGKPRVIVLDEAHRLSKAAQDALLKPVEEREFVVILCTTEPHKVGEALRSRCEEYPVTPPPVEVMFQRLHDICVSEQISFDPTSLRVVAKHLGSCPRASIASLVTFSELGGVTADSVRQVFRHSSLEAVVDVLCKIDSDPSSAIEVLSPVLSEEGPTWVRDQIISAIASACRESVGAKPNFPVPTRFFPSRGNRWTDLARTLSLVDKPNAADIESILLGSRTVLSPASIPPHQPPSHQASSISVVQSDSPQAPNVVTAGHTSVVTSTPPIRVGNTPPPPSPPLKSIPPPKSKGEAPRSVVKTVEIDGVIFTNHEELTSLDSKIEKGSCGAPTVLPRNAVEVELDKSKTPLPEKDFARGLIQRFQKTGI